MTEAEAYAFLQPVFRDVLGRRDLVLTPDLSRDKVRGWDSFKDVAIMLAIEDEFGIEFATADIDSIETVRDYVRVMVAQIR